MKTKVLITILVVILGVPTVTLGGSVTLSLISGKTTVEALEILAGQIDAVAGRFSSIEEEQQQVKESVEQNIAEVEAIKSENQALKEQVSIQAEEFDTKKRCDELKQGGPRYVSTKQPIDDLYESLSKQQAVSFDIAYAEHVEGGGKVLSKDAFKEKWTEEHAFRQDWLDALEPYYAEYTSACLTE